MAAPKKPEVQEALRLLAADKTLTPYAAAKRAGCSRWSVYSALKVKPESEPGHDPDLNIRECLKALRDALLGREGEERKKLQARIRALLEGGR